MFSFPAQMPGSFPFPQAMPAMYGKTQYKYFTPDGGPPMDGKVPSGSSFDPPNPFSAGNCVPGAMHPFGLPNTMSGSPCPWGAPPTPVQWYQCSPVGQPLPYSASQPPPRPPLPPPVLRQTHGQPHPQPASPENEFYSSSELEEPVQGNRVKGQLAKFDNGAGYIFPKDNCTIHIFSENVIAKYPARGNMIKLGNDRFKVHHAPCEMTFEDLIEGIDCRKRANHHAPWNQPGRGYPDALIGIQELLNRGEGWFEIGAKITVGGCRAKSKIGEMWPAVVGTAGQAEPRYIVRWPV